MDAVVGDEFSNNKQCDGGGGDPLVFNVLDSMLKGSLDRLKSMRSAFDFIVVVVGFFFCFWNLSYNLECGCLLRKFTVF
jgi:hypothetical protein